MNTLKSAALLVVLLGVLYGVFVALSKPELPDRSGPAFPDSAPVIEFGNNSSSFAPTAAPPAAPPLVHGQSDVSPANSGHVSRGGSYPSNLDTGAMPPPTTVPSAPPPLEPSVPAGSGFARSTYETPIASPAAPSSSSGSASQASALEAIPASTAPAEAAAAAAPALAAYALRRDMAEAEQLVAEGKFKSALAKLTPHHSHTELPSEQRALLFSWLDALAGKVIYSREHLLASAHQVRKGETLYDVAHQYNVEYRLLQNINSREVSDPLILVPGTELKVLPGPFHADVSLSSGEITLLVGDLYAGRFPFSVGDQPPQPGEYKVVDKRSQQKTYVGFDGRVVPANDPANPYGAWWISLGGEVAIHGSPSIPGAKTLGCISLSPQDSKDVYGILSIESAVKIRP